MMRWLRGLFKRGRAAPSREVLLNDGLELAMDWGENWLAPIQDRMRKKYAFLLPAELDELNAACQEAMKFGHTTAYELVRKDSKNASEEEFTSTVLARYPWINAGNLPRLFRQSTYYVWKGGGPLSKAAPHSST